MPRIANVNLLGVLLAAIVIYFVGFIWYGLLFAEPYMNGIGVFFGENMGTVTWMTPEGARTESQMPMETGWMIAGMVLPIVLAFGLGWHMKQKAITSLPSAVLYGLWLSLLIGVPLMAYSLVYTPWHSVPGFLVDASHTVVTIIAGCAVLSFFD
ncbi:MAG: DUF1761 domain-containing protein [Henriciella sp.]|uniref:DUF1761 domain-containing protein n=1 Tax=Henriciella sp. TaxID=1968823 RepID=UPI003C70CBB7